MWTGINSLTHLLMYPSIPILISLRFAPHCNILWCRLYMLGYFTCIIRISDIKFEVLLEYPYPMVYETKWCMHNTTLRLAQPIKANIHVVQVVWSPWYHLGHVDRYKPFLEWNIGNWMDQYLISIKISKDLFDMYQFVNTSRLLMLDGYHLRESFLCLRYY